MSAPSHPMVVGAKSASLVAGTMVTFRNLTQGDKIVVEASGGEALATPEGWEVGDVVSVEVKGKYNVSTSTTTTKSGVNASLSLSEDTGTVSIIL